MAIAATAALLWIKIRHEKVSFNKRGAMSAKIALIINKKAYWTPCKALTKTTEPRKMA